MVDFDQFSEIDVNVHGSSAILTDEQLTLTNIHGSLSMLTDQQFILTNFHKYLSIFMDFQLSW